MQLDTEKTGNTASVTGKNAFLALYESYTPGVSIVHRMEPRLKLFLTLAIIIGLPIHGLGFLLAFLGICFLNMLFSGIALRSIMQSLRSVSWFVTMMSLITCFSTPGTPLEISAFLPFDIAREGIEQGMLVVFRLILMFWLSMLVTSTTPPQVLLATLEKVCFNFKGRRIPSRDTLLVGLWAFQLVPLLFAKAEEHLLRELGKEGEGNIFKKTRNIGLILATFVIAVFRNADTFADHLDLPDDA